MIVNLTTTGGKLKYRTLEFQKPLGFAYALFFLIIISLPVAIGCDGRGIPPTEERGGDGANSSVIQAS